MTPHAQWDALMALHEKAEKSQHHHDYDVAANALYMGFPALAAEYRRMREELAFLRTFEMDVRDSACHCKEVFAALDRVNVARHALRGAKGEP